MLSPNHITSKHISDLPGRTGGNCHEIPGRKVHSHRMPATHEGPMNTMFVRYTTLSNIGEVEHSG